jgi:ribose transport system ATP-binding protein
MDEPTASLSESEVIILFDIIRRLKEKGVSIIYISHRMNEILKIADEVTVLRDGKNVITAPGKDLDIEAIINHMMGEQVEKVFEWQERHYTGSNERLLEVNGLEVNECIRDVSFYVNQGEVLGFAGLMGSGRTEIVESLFGIRGRCNGEIAIDGQKVTIKNVQNAIDAGLALVPEDRRRQGLILMHSVKQNITLPLLKKLQKRILLDDKKATAVATESVASLT